MPRMDMLFFKTRDASEICLENPLRYSLHSSKGTSVSIEAFDAGEDLHEWKAALGRYLTHAHNAAAALELVGADAGE